MKLKTSVKKGVHASIQELMSYQGIAKHIHWLKHQRPTQGHIGAHRAKRLGQGMEFQECRPYQAGDDTRHIHWRVTARSHQPYSKIYSEDHERPLGLWLDLNSSMYFGTRQHFKSVLAVKIAATLAWSSHLQQERVAALLDTPQSTHFIPPQQRTGAILQLMGQLAAATHVEPGLVSDTPAPNPLRPHVKALPSGSILCILTDAYQPLAHWQAILSALKQRYCLHFIHIHDPIESRFDRPAFYPVTHQDQTHQINMHSPQCRTQLHNQFEQKQRQLEHMCQQHGASWHQISTQATWQQLLQRW